ncbi:MAG TPA: rhodanese-like domain-containing protein [Syntrophorhabdaceae bacterium]|nr:rhodanese-like domain-containing protein [Syntrophorhabdaceae bacterium]
MLSLKKLAFILVVMIAMTPYAARICKASHEEIPRITIEELKRLIDSGTDVVIIDAQVKSLYNRGHIRKAINLPWKTRVTLTDVENIPPDKLVVVYCDCGPGESDSSDIAAQLSSLGYFDVKVLADPSIRGWIEAGYPVEK